MSQFMAPPRNLTFFTRLSMIHYHLLGAHRRGYPARPDKRGAEEGTTLSLEPEGFFIDRYFRGGGGGLRQNRNFRRTRKIADIFLSSVFPGFRFSLDGFISCTNLPRIDDLFATDFLITDRHVAVTHFYTTRKGAR